MTALDTPGFRARPAAAEEVSTPAENRRSENARLTLKKKIYGLQCVTLTTLSPNNEEQPCGSPLTSAFNNPS